MIWWCRQTDKPCSMANENGYCQITACCNTSKPTVKAIPIEWIKKWYRRALDNSGFMGDETISVGDLLEDWEKENE